MKYNSKTIILTTDARVKFIADNALGALDSYYSEYDEENFKDCHDISMEEAREAIKKMYQMIIIKV